MAPESSHTNQSPAGKVSLVGAANFVRQNPRSDLFKVQRFHHIEFWTADATSTYKRFQHGLGLSLVAKSDQSTGNPRYASYVLKSNELVFTFTAPYSTKASQMGASSSVPWPHYDQGKAYEFLKAHGLGVRAVGLLVDDADDAFHKSVDNGAIAVLPPFKSTDAITGMEQTVAEVSLYGDVVLRYVSGSFQGPFLSNYTPVEDAPTVSYGLQRLDHAVGNVPELLPVLEYVMRFTGFHEFAEFVAEDIGTLDSGLNSMVLASNNAMVLLPINEPTFGTRRKSQIQTYLEQNKGAGVQHLALKTFDIFHTLREMQARSYLGGFEFMPRPSEKYYRGLPDKIGDSLTAAQLEECEKLGILVDKDEKGILLQIFTKPLGYWSTIFIKIIGCGGGLSGAGGLIIQRLGCLREIKDKSEAEGEVHQQDGTLMEQSAGCGGFGKGNFSELFKRIEDYERTLNI
eukprot:gene24026-9601_t